MRLIREMLMKVGKDHSREKEGRRGGGWAKCLRQQGPGGDEALGACSKLRPALTSMRCPPSPTSDSSSLGGEIVPTPYACLKMEGEEHL